MKALIDEGLQIWGSILYVVLKRVICDVLAKAMVKCLKQYSGYYGFDKCDQ